MAKSKYLLLILPLFLASCGSTSTSNTLPSTDSGSNSTSSNSESTSSNVDGEVTQETVNEKIGDISKLKTLFSEYNQKDIVSFITESSDYSGKTTKTHLFTNNEYKCETTKGSKSFVNYEGLVDNIYYTYSNEYNASATREKVLPDLTEGQQKDYSKKYYSETLNEIKKNYSYADITSTYNWGAIFKQSKEESYGITGPVIDTYNALLVGNKILLQIEAFENTYSGYATKKYSIGISYSVVAEFDTSFVLKSGTLETKNYQAENLDETNHRPIEGATPSLTKSLSINEIVFGNHETSTSTMIDFTNAFTTSITEKAYITTSYLNQETWDYVSSNKNEVFVGSTLDNSCLTLSDDSGVYYLPATAIDNGGNASIVASSNESIISFDSSANSFVVTDNEEAINEVVTLTIGNEFVEAMGTIDVKIVADPSSTSSGGGSSSSEVPVLDDSISPYIHKGASIATYDATNSKLTITGTSDVVLCIPVYSPMDLYNEQLMNNVELYLETSKITGKILTPTESGNYEGICIQFNANENCSTYSGLFNKNNGNPMIGFDLVVNLA